MKKRIKQCLGFVLCAALLMQTVSPLRASSEREIGQDMYEVDITEASGIDKAVFESARLFVREEEDRLFLTLDYRLMPKDKPAVSDNQAEETTTEEITEEEVTEEATTEESTSEETATEETATGETTTEESTVPETSAPPEITVPETSAPPEIMVPGTSAPPEITVPETTASSETEETVAVSSAAFYAQSNQDAGSADKAVGEMIPFSLAFSDAFVIAAGEAGGDVLDKTHTKVGNYSLTQAEEGIILRAAITVSQGESDALQGSVNFLLDKQNKDGKEGILFWNGATQRIEYQAAAKEDISSYILDAKGRSRGGSTLNPDQKAFKVSLLENLDFNNQDNSKVTQMFSKLDLALTVTRGKKELDIQIDGNIKNEYLDKILEAAETDAGLAMPDVFPYTDSGTGDTYATLGDWLNAKISDSDKLVIPPIQFTYVFAENKISTDEEYGFNIGTLPIKVPIIITKPNPINGGNPIGEYTLTKDPADKTVTMNCTLQNKMYSYRNVVLGAGFKLNGDGELGDKEIFTFDVKDGQFICTGTEELILPGEPGRDHPYTLTKTTDSGYGENEPYLNYTISADSYSGLASTDIVDTLPKELMLLKASLVTTKRDGTPVTTVLTNADGTSNNAALTITPPPSQTGAILTYQFEPSSDIVKADLKVETMLTADALFGMKGGGSVTFENKAALQYEKDGIPNQLEDAVNNTKKISVFGKTGKQNEADGRVFDWTIDIDAYFKGTDSTKVYMVDSLNPQVHNYKGDIKVEVGTLGAGGTFAVDNAYTSSCTEKIGCEGEVNLYSKVTASALNTITGGDRAVSYTSKADTERVLAVNITDYLANNQKKHIRITYSTQAVNTGGGEFSNQADLRWENLSYGNGELGENFEFDLNISKDTTVTEVEMTKRPGDYNASTQLQEWFFDVNYYGLEQRNVVIEEDFSDSKNQMIPTAAELTAAGKLLCSVNKVTRGNAPGSLSAGDSIPVGTSSSTPPYYEITDANKIAIHLGDIAEGDYYTISFVSKLGREAVSSNQTGYSVINQAAISAGDPAHPTQEEITATKTIDNTLITKAAPNFVTDGKEHEYDYDKNALKWSVTINPNSLTIKDALITDTLPADNDFGMLTKVTYGGEELSSLNLTGQAGSQITGAIGSSGIYVKADATQAGKVLFTPVDSSGTSLEIKKPLTVEFTTKLSQDFLNRIYTESDTTTLEGDGTYNTEFTNTARLTGKITDRIAPGSHLVTAEAIAKHNVRLAPLSKKGIYQNPGIIKWEALINQGKGSLVGLKVVEDFSAKKLEYKKESLKIYKPSLKADGTYEEAELASSEVTGSDRESLLGASLQEGGFTLTFPTGCTDTYLIRFETFITEDATPAEITNQLSLKYQEKDLLKSNVADGGLTGDFSLNDYSTGSPVPILAIQKVSASIDDSDLNQLKLQDVEFEIDELTYSGMAWGNPTKIKVKETNENGKRLFLNLEYDKLYCLKEVAAPPGYTLGKDKYILFLNTLPAGGAEVTAAQTYIDANANGCDLVVVAKGSTYKRFTIKNDPKAGSDGEISIKKLTDHNGTKESLEGATFELRREDNLVETQTKTSDAQGIVTFEKVDPGIYFIKETEVDDKNYSILPGEIKVTKAADSFTVDSGVTINAQKQIEITNDLAKANLEITKKDAIRNDTLQGAKYNLSGTDYLDHPLGGTAIGIEATTGSNGIATFANIPVSKTGVPYILKEITYPTGYHQDVETKYEVTVTGSENKAKITMKQTSPAPIAPETGNIPVTQAKPGDKASVTLENQPITGKIQFTKRAMGREDTEYAPLSGAEFGLYKTANDNAVVKTADGSDAKATSDASGAVIFDNIYYGNYVIKEIKAPDGYIKSTDHIAVTKAQLGIAADKLSFAYTVSNDAAHAYKLDNKLAKAKLTIEKLDQNKTPLQGVTFLAERWDAAANAGAGAYVGYNLPLAASSDNRVTTNADGIAELGNLTHGLYRIAEVVQPGIIITPAAPHYIKVGIAANAVKAAWFAAEPTDKSPDNFSGSNTITLNAGAGKVTWENALKHGLIQVHKVKGITQNNQIKLAETGGAPIALDGAEFAVYLAEDVDASGANPAVKPGKTPFVSLKTDANGELPHTLGVYTDVHDTSKKVKLILGDYYLQEVKAPQDCIPDTTLYPFTLTKHYIEQDAFVTVSNTGSNTVTNGVSGTEYFVNEIPRTGILLEKADNINSTKKLSGAEFVVYTGNVDGSGVAVASLAEKDPAAEKGMYRLSNEIPLSQQVSGGASLYSEVTAEGIPYITEDAGSFALLAGTYHIEEVKVPNGYHTDATLLTKRTFLVTANGTVTALDPIRIVNDGGNQIRGLYKNVRGGQDVTVQKAIDTDGINAALLTVAMQSTEGFSFTLKGTTAEGEAYTYEAGTPVTDQIVTDSNGKAVFTKIPYGAYTITENKNGKESSYVLASPVEITVNEQGVFKKGDTTTPLTQVEVKNRLKHGSVNGTKLGRGDGLGGQITTPLTGVEFSLYRDNPDTTTPPPVALTTATSTMSGGDAVFSFTKLPLGTYFIKETGTPQNYLPDITAKRVEVTEDGKTVTISAIENKVKKAAVTLTKTDVNQANTKLTGAVFGIYGNENHNKNILVAYLLDAGVPGDYTLAKTYEGRTVLVVLSTLGMPCLLEEAGRLSLSCGSYYVKEIKAPPYYELSTVTSLFTIDGAEGGSGEVIFFTNTRLPEDVSFLKVDDGAGYGVDGAEFSVYTDASCTTPYQVGGTDLKVISEDGTGTSALGLVTFSQLPAGTYYFRETALPSNTYYTGTIPGPIYKIVAEGTDKAKITLASDITNTPVSKIQNALSGIPATTKLDITLTNTAGQPLGNREFSLYRVLTGGRRVLMATAFTDANGWISFRGLLPGDYIVLQDTTKDDYIKDNAEHPVTIPTPPPGGEGYARVDVVNIRLHTSEGGSGPPDTITTTPKALVKTPVTPAEIPADNTLVLTPGMLPKTGGLVGSAFILLCGLGLVAFGIYKRKKK